jgi:TPP-dependent indolepyruvate ferredoxin oxidoreductase alpha subunit
VSFANAAAQRNAATAETGGQDAQHSRGAEVADVQPSDENTVEELTKGVSEATVE